jgi:predicted anti-sigma-YlaC factor YlaD
MRCSKAIQQLQLYLDHQLPLDSMRILEAHLAQCRTCQEELRLLEAVTQGLRGIPPVAEPADLTATIMRRVALTPRRKEEHWYTLLRLSLLEILVAICLATLTTLGIILEQPPLRAVLPFGDGYQALSQTFTHLLMNVSSTFIVALWVIGAILGVCITLVLAGHEMRAQWWRAMLERLPVW